MAGFQYFIERPRNELVDNKRLLRQPLADCGLTDVFADCVEVPDDCVVEAVDVGPNGKPGCVLTPKTPTTADPATWRCDGRVQSWEKVTTIIPRPYWIGWTTADPPKPEDLARRVQYTDYTIADADEQRWALPTAIADKPTSLPRDFVYDLATGRYSTALTDDFQQLWVLAQQVADHFTGVKPQSLTWLALSAIRVLQTNYRVNPAGLEILRKIGRSVLSQTAVVSILLALIDNALEQEYLRQKKANETETTGPLAAPDCTTASPGSPETCPTTDQAAAP